MNPFLLLLLLDAQEAEKWIIQSFCRQAHDCLCLNSIFCILPEPINMGEHDLYIELQPQVSLGNANFNFPAFQLEREKKRGLEHQSRTGNVIIQNVVIIIIQLLSLNLVGHHKMEN